MTFSNALVSVSANSFEIPTTSTLPVVLKKRILVRNSLAKRKTRQCVNFIINIYNTGSLNVKVSCGITGGRKY